MQHHYDSYSISPESFTKPPASLTLFVHTHSAKDATGNATAGLTMRDVRWAILADHLYHTKYPAGASEGVQGPSLSEAEIERLVS